MGAMSDWYRLIRAAKYLGVAPWELARQPAAWMNLALAAEGIDRDVEAELIARQRKRK